ncbi:MAG: PPOX class F420-dependent oxidoreductase [Actinomycetota bacterium]|nr:PPOX class F420-dependent oxidoreductase [Actinomycetota bacterium]
MLTDRQAQILSEPNSAVVTTLRKDGSAHSTLAWVDWDGEFVLINTVVGRIKERHLRRDNRISVCVVDRNNTNWYLGVEGRAELVTEGAAEHFNKITREYLGRDGVLKEGAVRIIARFRPDKVWGIFDEGSQAALVTGRDWERNGDGG